MSHGQLLHAVVVNRKAAVSVLEASGTATTTAKLIDPIHITNNTTTKEGRYAPVFDQYSLLSDSQGAK
jgi:hypothetical protein